MAQENTNEEIKWLEEQLEAKKKALAESGGEARPEKEIIKEAVKEVASAAQPPYASSSQTISDDDAQKAAHDLQEKNHASVIEELVAAVFSKGLHSALKIANAIQNPHILDEFHDVLADQYYEKLVEAKKLNKT